MKVKSLLFVGISLLLFPNHGMAQFYTIMREKEKRSKTRVTLRQWGTKVMKTIFMPIRIL